MKLTLICALFAAVMVCRSYGQGTCDIAKCMPDAAIMQNTDDLEKICGEVKKTISCYETVLGECKKANVATADNVEEMMKAQKKMLDEKCGCAAIQMSFFTMLAAFLVYMFL